MEKTEETPTVDAIPPNASEEEQAPVEDKVKEEVEPTQSKRPRRGQRNVKSEESAPPAEETPKKRTLRERKPKKDGENDGEKDDSSGLRSLYEMHKEMEDDDGEVEEKSETETEGEGYSDGESKKKKQGRKRGPKSKKQQQQPQPQPESQDAQEPQEAAAASNDQEPLAFELEPPKPSRKSTGRKRKSETPVDPNAPPAEESAAEPQPIPEEIPYTGPTDSLGRRKPPRSRVQKWTVEEDEILKRIVPTMKDISWKKVAEQIPGKNENQCFQHWNRVLDPNIKKGPWTPEEEAELEKSVEEIKDRSHVWARVAAMTEGRIDTQCRYQWGIIDRSKSAPWDKNEDQLLCNMVDPHNMLRFGEAVDWIRVTSKFNSRKQVEVGKHLPVRCSSHVKQRFELLTGKKTGTLFLAQLPKTRSENKRSPKRLPPGSMVGGELDVNFLSSNAVPQMAPLPPRHFEQNGAFQEIPGFAGNIMLTHDGSVVEQSTESQGEQIQSQSQEEGMPVDPASQSQTDASSSQNWSETAAESAAPFLKFVEMGQQAQNQAQQNVEEQVQEESSGFVREPVQSLPHPFQNNAQNNQPQQVATGQQGEYDFTLYE